MTEKPGSDTDLFESETWGIVEVLGHNTFAGKMSQHVLGGTAFIRVDVPEIPETKETRYQSEYTYPAIPAYTKLIGAGSIYAITPCSEAVARKMALSKRVSPVEVLDLEVKIDRLAIAGSASEEEEDVPY